VARCWRRSRPTARSIDVDRIAIAVQRGGRQVGVERAREAVVGDPEGLVEVAVLVVGGGAVGDALAFVRGVRGHVDEPLDGRVGAGVGDDGPAVAVPDEHDAAVDPVEHAPYVVGIGVEVGPRQVDGDGGHRQLVEPREHRGPAPRAVPSPVNEHHRAHPPGSSGF
jgi:hypothetical protein